jgi:hypothetical protein
MSRSSVVARRWIAGVASAALVVTGAIALTPSASGAPGLEAKKKPTPRNAYIYGNWSAAGTGFTDDSAQVYQLVGRAQLPQLNSTDDTVFATGTFTKAGGTTVNRVAMWNGSAWVNLPGDDTGIDPGVAARFADNYYPGVFGAALNGDDSIFIGGSFTRSDDTLNNVARWNGSDWRPMGKGLFVSDQTDADAPVQDMIIGNDFIGGDDTNYSDDTIYAVGGFTGLCLTFGCGSGAATRTDTYGVAQYSQGDDTWVRMSPGTMTGRSVYSGAFIDDTLYVGGQFTALGGKSVANIAQYSNADDTWLPLGTGLPGTARYDGVYAMAVHPTTKDLYVAGNFDDASNGRRLIGIAKWDYRDDTWYTVGNLTESLGIDDISFSPDGNTMYVAPNATSGAGVGTFNYLLTLQGGNLDDTATNTGGTFGYIKSAGVIGVTPGWIRSMITKNDGSMLAGGNFNTAGPVSAKKVATFTPGPEPSPYDPVYPPGVPTDVVATGGWNNVTVEWKAPTYTGSYPITNYLVQASPGGNVCITRLSDPKQNQCTYTSLTPGTKYTFRVQGLNGGGWGDRSAASNVATPQNLKITSHNRKKLNFFLGGGSEVTAAGVAPGFAPGTKIVPWVKIGDRAWESAATSGLTVSSVERFSWKRKFNKKQNSTPISVRFEIGGNFSNTVLLRPVK